MLIFSTFRMTASIMVCAAGNMARKAIKNDEMNSAWVRLFNDKWTGNNDIFNLILGIFHCHESHFQQNSFRGKRTGGNNHHQCDQACSNQSLFCCAIGVIE